MRVRAPGKLVVLGEYAVLDGAPAVCAAVDRGVDCEVHPAGEVAAGDVVDVTVPPGADDRFVAAALRAVDAAPGRYAFSAWNPVNAPDGVKVGLGSSAAATVAAILAGHLASGRDVDAARRLATAMTVHRAVQGSGSGIDVATSTFGGVIRFEAGGVTPLDATLLASVVFSGVPAATGPRVERYLAWSDAARARFVDRSWALADDFAADPVGALREAAGLLRRMADDAGIPYWTDAIGAIVAAAEAEGGAAKPSGAGGGDVVVALFADPDRRAAFEGAVGGAGFLVVPVGIAGPAADVRGGPPG